MQFSDKDEHVYFWFPLLAGLSELTFDPRPDFGAPLWRWAPQPAKLQLEAIHIYLRHVISRKLSSDTHLTKPCVIGI